VRIVLDTAALITALRSSTGAAAENVRLALLRQLTILMDYKLACEYRDVALRPEHLAASGKTRKEIELLLDALEAVAEPVLVTMQHRPLSQDANDDMVLDVAINGRADAIVTNNTKHFRDAVKQFRIRVLTPAELLSEFRKKG
jgi:putative PIN family toxin of toxin-antitoxin system